jgi:DNA-binding NarL/FixJ family response regulator
VKAHLTALFRKIGVRSRTQAVIALKGMELHSGIY